MSLIKTSFTVLSLIGCLIARAQDYNPYKSIGKKAKVLTLSNGRYDEFFDTDSIQRIGTVLFNIKTKKIVKLLNPEYVYRKTSDNSSSSRWYTVDRLSEKYASWSPYTFVADNPILFSDPNGDSLKVLGTTDLLNRFVAVANQGLGGYYTASIDKDGQLTLTSTDKEGEMSKSQSAFYKSLNGIVTDEKTLTVGLVDQGKENGGDMAMVGSNAYHLIDIGDVEKAPGGAITKQGMLIHELVEQKFINWDHMDQDNAHLNAMIVENQVNGSLRMPFPESSSKFTIQQGMFPLLSGNLDNKYIQNGTQYIYRTQVKDNDIISIRIVDTVIPKEMKKHK